MKKFILSIFVIASFGFYVIWQGANNSSNNLTMGTTVIPSGNTNPPSGGSTPVAIVSKPKSTPNPTSVVSPPKNGIYNDGTYIGSVADAYYGNIQVEAIISGGRLVDVQFLDYPQDRGTSVRINSRALPILKQEAIAAQSANVNGVSGASETSPAFIQSLTSALSQAKA